MSLVLIYHDKKRAVIACDDRAHVEVEGQKRRLEGRFPKFVVLPNGLIFGGCGRVDLSDKLMRGTMKLVAANPDVKFADLAGFLPFTLRTAFESRSKVSISAGSDRQHQVLCGWDVEAGRVRCIFWFSDDGFKPVPTTLAEDNRIAAIGAFEAEDEPALSAFTADVGRRGEKFKPAWIAAQLSMFVNGLSEKHPEQIGRASYFAALDRSGLIDLPAEFPQPPKDVISPVMESASASGLGRMFIGSITTPRQGALDTVGNNDGGSGAQFGLGTTLGPTVVQAVNLSGTGTTSNPWFASDGDDTTYAEMHVQLTGASFNHAGLQVQGPASVLQRNISAVLRVVWSCPQNDGVDRPFQTYFQIFDQATGGFLFQFSLANSTTYPVTETLIPIPDGVNLSRYYFGADVAEGPTPGGDIYFRIHEVQWLTVA